MSGESFGLGRNGGTKFAPKSRDRIGDNFLEGGEDIEELSMSVESGEIHPVLYP